MTPPPPPDTSPCSTPTCNRPSLCCRADTTFGCSSEMSAEWVRDRRGGRRWRWAATPVRCLMWPPSWVVTGTRRTGRCWSGVRHCWPPTAAVWARWRPWVSMRPCSGATAGGVGATGAPRSSTCTGVNCSTLSLVATPRVPPRGSSRNPRRGATASTGACWTSPARTGAPSKQRCPTPARSPTRSTSSAWPTTASTRCAGAPRTTRSGAAAARTTPFIGRDGSHFRPRTPQRTWRRQTPRPARSRRPPRRGAPGVARQRNPPRPL